MKLYNLILLFLPIHGKLQENDKTQFCESLECDESVDDKVCGVKYGEKGVIFKPFDNQCKLLKYGCQVADNETYGIIDMRHCTAESIKSDQFNTCAECTESGDRVCGIRPEGEGFKIRIFGNECRLNRYNCEEGHEELQFTVTDFFICSNHPSLEEKDGDKEILEEEDSPVTIKVNETNTKPNTNKTQQTKTKQIPTKTKNLVIVDGSMLDRRNINDSIRNFFAATHVLDLPMRDIQPMLNESTRKRLIHIFGPVTVFRPWVKIPKNISDDYLHKPTLGSCYHTCPTKCPDTYAPVCGVPGIVAREPSLMFQNHCYMDVAQCKMHWEDKSYTAESSAYIESSFVFCLGEELNGVYRFLPLIRTLQHMGRLKNRGKFKYKLRNMRFFNNLIAREPKLMG